MSIPLIITATLTIDRELLESMVEQDHEFVAALIARRAYDAVYEKTLKELSYA